MIASDQPAGVSVAELNCECSVTPSLLWEEERRGAVVEGGLQRKEDTLAGIARAVNIRSSLEGVCHRSNTKRKKKYSRNLNYYRFCNFEGYKDNNYK